MDKVQLSRRNYGEDAVRVIGLVAIVVGHVWYIEPVIRWTYSWQFPLFFMLAGYHWVAGRTLREELHERFLSIGRPFLVWWVIVGAFYVVWQWFVVGPGYVPTKPIVMAAWGGQSALRPWTAFWFFSAFFIAVLFVRWSSRPGWWWTLAFGYLAMVFCYVEHAAAMRAPLASVSAVACTGFVLFGMGLRQLRHRAQRPGFIGFAFLMVGIGGVLLPIYRPLNLKAADFSIPLLSILVAAFIGSGLILLGSAVAPRIPEALGRVISMVARCTVAVLLSHGILLFMLGTPRSGGWLDFLIVLGVPLLFALVTLRSRWEPWLHGVREISYRGGSHKQFPGAMLRPDPEP